MGPTSLVRSDTSGRAAIRDGAIPGPLSSLKAKSSAIPGKSGKARGRSSSGTWPIPDIYKTLFWLSVLIVFKQFTWYV